LKNQFRKDIDMGRHAGIVCDNLGKMVEFYKLLGCEEIINSKIEGKLIDDLIDLENANIQIVKLKPLLDNTVIELLKYKNINLPSKNRKLYEQGLSHVAITVSNVDSVYKKLKAKGIKFNTPPILSAKDNVKVCFCRDVEGNWIELVEELPVKKNSYLDVVYNEKVRPKTNYPEKLVQYLINRFNIKKDSILLDVGCGRREHIDMFEKYGIESYGIDLENYDGKKVLKANLESDELPFDNNSFDVVFGKSILEHLNCPLNMMKEVYRILKPGGLFINLVPDWRTCIYLYYTDSFHKQPYCEEALYDLLLISGFKEVQTEEFFQLPVVWKYPILRIVCKFLQLFGAPKKIVRNKFLRWSRETMVLGIGIKGE